MYSVDHLDNYRQSSHRREIHWRVASGWLDLRKQLISCCLLFPHHIVQACGINKISKKKKKNLKNKGLGVSSQIRGLCC